MNAHSKPIFLHSQFRTGSTYVWSKFRETEDYYCYYEPFHEALADLTEEIRRENIDDKTASMSHPKLKRHYFDEYPLNEGCGVRYFHKEFTVDTYCMEADEKNESIKRYIGCLVDQAPRRAVFGFCRSTMRTAWLMNNFDAFNIFIIRNHRNQWESYQSFQGDPYFNTVNLMILGKNGSSIKLQPLQAFFQIPYYENKVFATEYQFYKKYMSQLTDSERYHIFFYLWLLSFIENYSACELVLNVDALSLDDSARQSASEMLRRSGIYLSFSDCSIRFYDNFTLSDKEMSSIEWTAIRMIQDASIYDQGIVETAIEYLNLSIDNRADQGAASQARVDHIAKLGQSLTDQITERDRQIEHLETVCANLEKAIEDKEAQITEADASLGIYSGRLSNVSSILEGVVNHLETEEACSHMLNGIGEMCAILDKHDMAERTFSIALTKEPNSAVIFNNLGTLYFARGDYRSAIGCFLKACTIDPDDQAACQNLQIIREILSMPYSHDHLTMDGNPRKKCSEAMIREYDKF